ncbi:carbon-phosphorus lyase complex subunit PhnI [Bradyrhizobium sp. CCBAU 53421]|uniref:carbon-phosphorus lyase complex subunit PhnI n=1 Tax=Bradyrhizobium sp. CCBAU 53421 TaxID=1325120 RepID=UPI00188C675F|nr:carbon-phosphorus lyase complex subunit PhnI [Bradyrhizobium sp. CCBAU 53421]QOZ33240.1 carbon-phosphorus lyase complex subunit PhnI [Bradyrhizobium sp. CCBAU 53421]
MAYVAVKGGEHAILNAHKLLAEERRGDTTVPELTLDQISGQLGLAIDRVMNEGSMYDRRLAALALKQAQGDLAEAIFLLRAYRTTLPRIAASEPIDTKRMFVRRRVSGTFKDLPGGQLLGPTYDYTHRLLDFSLAESVDEGLAGVPASGSPIDFNVPSVLDVLDGDGLIESAERRAGREPFDLTRSPMRLPAGRDQRLQNLVRGDEGFIVGLAYSSARGYGGSHPYVAEMRLGEVDVEIVPEELGFPIVIGEITVTECQMISQFDGSAATLPHFTRGYGLTLGHCERKAMSMALVDRTLRARELGEEVRYPAQDEEFVLSHSDSVEATGLISHYKLPHYVDFQADLQLIRNMRAERLAAETKARDESSHEIG